MSEPGAEWESLNPFRMPEESAVGNEDGVAINQEALVEPVEFPAEPEPPQLPDAVVQALAASQPRVRFLSVLSGVFGILLLIQLIAFLAPRVRNTVGPGAITSNGVMLVSLLYVFFGISSLVGAMHLWNCANLISKLKTSNAFDDLEKILQAQYSLWRVVGLAATAFLALYGGAQVFAVFNHTPR